MSRQRANDEGPLTIPELLLSNKSWAKYMRGQTNRRPVNAEGVYGTHRDYRWKWVPDVNDPQHRGSWRKMTAGKRPMTVYGSVNWDSLWPDWRSVGNEFLQTGTADDPLTYEQRLALRKQMKKSIYVIRSFHFMKFRLKNSFYFLGIFKISSILNFNFYKIFRIFIDNQYRYQSLQLDKM